MNETRPATSPRDVFLYILAIVALYISVISFASLVFTLINIAFPSPLDFVSYESMRWSLALLIIIFPTYVLISQYLYRDLVAHPEKRALRTRRWLIYLTLFLASVAMLVNLVSLVYTFLQGDFTIRFFLKVLTVVILAGAVAIYYYWDLTVHKAE